MSEFEKIKEISQSEVSECSCSKCKHMCTVAPCLGTADDINRIIAHGYGSRLSAVIWATGFVTGQSPLIEMVQPTRLESGHCTFFTDQGLCELHELGIKPTEGKLVDHNFNPAQDYKKTANYLTAASWMEPANRKKLARLTKYLIKIQPDEEER